MFKNQQGERNCFFGHHHTAETRNRISGKMKKIMVGNKHGCGNKGKTRSEEARQKNREWHITHPFNKFSDTSIEMKIESELKARGISYQKQVPLCHKARVDFYLPEYRIVIQCDGDYWHNLPKMKTRDTNQDWALIFNGFNVYRFWEHEINESPQNCIDKVLNQDP